MSGDARTCHHEAGHAVLAVLLGVPFAHVAVHRPGDSVAGEVTGLQDLTPIIDFAVSFAGPASESLFLGGFQHGADPIPAWRTGLERADSLTWTTDMEEMRRIKRGLLTSTANRAADETLQRIARRWNAVQIVASVLGRRKVLSRDEVQTLLSKGECR